MKLTHYSIASAPHVAGTNWLVPDLSGDDFDQAQELLEEPDAKGRLDRKPLRIACEVGDSDIDPSPLPYASQYGGMVLADDAFLKAIERVKAAQVAHAVTLTHGEKSWEGLWLIRFTEKRVLKHLRDDSLPAFVPRELSTVLFSTTAMNAIREAMPYPWLTFKQHESSACTSEPLGEGAEADAKLLKKVKAAWLDKVPKPEVGANYGTSWMLELLLTEFSDLTDERIAQAIERTKDDDLVLKRYPDGRVDGIGIRVGSALATRFPIKQK